MPFYGTGALLFDDDFTYSDGLLTAVGGAKWSNGYWAGQESLRVVSNKLAGGAVNGWFDNYSDVSFSVATNGIEIIYRNISPLSTQSTWTYMHALGTPAASPSGYYWRWRNDVGFGLGFGQLNAGAFVSLMQTTTQVAVGDDIALQILPDKTMSLWRKPSGGSWAQIGSTIIDGLYTSGVIGNETFLSAERWDAVEVREVLTSGIQLTPTITWGSIVASVDAAAPFTVTGALPTHAAGDILIACACKNDASALTCATSGWASIVAAENNANLSTAWFWKRATSSAETAPVITSSTAGSTSTGIYVTCARIRGCIATGTPFEDATLNGSPTNTTTPVSSLITTTGTKRLVLAVAQIDDNNAISSGYPPADWTGVANTGSDTGGDAKTLAIVTPAEVAEDVPAANIGVQAASDYWKTLTLAFIPPAAPSATPSRFKRWNGSSWVEANFKQHNGSIWVPKTWKKLP